MRTGEFLCFFFLEKIGCGWFGSHCWSPPISAGPKLALHSTLSHAILLVLSLLCTIPHYSVSTISAAHCPTPYCWYYHSSCILPHTIQYYTVGTISGGAKLAHSSTNYLLLPFLLKLPIFHYVDGKKHTIKPAFRPAISTYHW